MTLELHGQGLQEAHHVVSLITLAEAGMEIRPGDRAGLSVQGADPHLFDIETGERLAANARMKLCEA